MSAKINSGKFEVSNDLARIPVVVCTGFHVYSYETASELIRLGHLCPECRRPLCLEKANQQSSASSEESNAEDIQQSNVSETSSISEEEMVESAISEEEMVKIKDAVRKAYEKFIVIPASISADQSNEEQASISADQSNEEQASISADQSEEPITGYTRPSPGTNVNQSELGFNLPDCYSILPIDTQGIWDLRKLPILLDRLCKLDRISKQDIADSMCDLLNLIYSLAVKTTTNTTANTTEYALSDNVLKSYGIRRPGRTSHYVLRHILDQRSLVGSVLNRFLNKFDSQFTVSLTVSLKRHVLLNSRFTKLYSMFTTQPARQAANLPASQMPVIDFGWTKDLAIIDDADVLDLNSLNGLPVDSSLRHKLALDGALALFSMCVQCSDFDTDHMIGIYLNMVRNNLSIDGNPQPDRQINPIVQYTAKDILENIPVNHNFRRWFATGEWIQETIIDTPPLITQHIEILDRILRQNIDVLPDDYTMLPYTMLHAAKFRQPFLTYVVLKNLFTPTTRNMHEGYSEDIRDTINKNTLLGRAIQQMVQEAAAQQQPRVGQRVTSQPVGSVGSVDMSCPFL